MMNIIRLYNYYLPCLLLVFSQSVFALETIDWEGLVPPLDMPEDTYSQLDEELQESLYDLFMIRELKANGSSSENMDLIEKKARAALEAEGVDGDKALQEIDEYEQRLRENDTKLVTELNGRMVKMPGYVLPTEYSDNKVVEFMLVPYVGACIHTPPPPANQMVHVRLAEGFESEGLFMPVWVTGKISTTSTTQTIAYEDGETSIDAGYSMLATSVVRYE